MADAAATRWFTSLAIGSADALADESGQWMVNVRFANDDFVDKVARPYMNQQVAIVFDQQVVSAPTINPNIISRDVTMSGTLTEAEARDIALVLRYGALPLKLQFVSVAPSR